MTTAICAATLPMPDDGKPLSSNRRAHWSKHRAHSRHWREHAYYAVREQVTPGHGVERVHVKVLLTPPDARNRDEDNYVAHVLKPIKDGVADALKLPDDTSRHVTYQVGILDPQRGYGWRCLLIVEDRTGEAAA